MSWDAYLDAACCGMTIRDWNYTHNTNGMIAAAYESQTGQATEQASGPLGPAIGAAWWDRLNGAEGEAAVEYLTAIITGLEADPVRFRAMEPDNGWGGYDGVLGVLREMREAAVTAHSEGKKTRWVVHG